MFIDFPDGERREADVVAKLETFDRSPELVLIHVEVQLRPEPEFEARMFDYYALLWSRYKIPIFPIVLYLDGGDAGTSQEEYRVRLFGRDVLRFRYESVRLERLNVEEYLDKVVGGRRARGVDGSVLERRYRAPTSLDDAAGRYQRAR